MEVTKHDMVEGYIHKTQKCGNIEIVKYVNSYEKVAVRFIGYDHIIETTADRIRKGVVKNIFLPSVFGMGYKGLGKYSATKDKKAHQVWTGMLQRCYSSEYHSRQPSYEDCTVCEDWLNFQIFAEWFYSKSNYMPGLQLDKDIKNKDNKQYSPEFCLFVPQSLNVLMRQHKGVKKDGCPVGVQYHKRDKCFKAGIRYEGVQDNLGCFPTCEEASNAYQEARKSKIALIVQRNTYPELTVYLEKHL